MNHSDKHAFRDLFDGLSEIYNPDKKLSKTALQIYFGSLEKYSFDQISQAVSKHVADSKHGSFFPKVADLIRHIEGGEITHDQVISAARLASTPFGVLCRIHIGHWDLENQRDMFYLKQRAQECLDLLPEWKEKAFAGDYSDHEISVMLKYEVNPTAPLTNGLVAPPNTALLEQRAEAIRNTKKHTLMLERPHNHDKSEESKAAHNNIKEHIARIMDE